MWTLAEKELESRLLLGTAQYRSPQSLKESIEQSGCQVVTVSLRRCDPEKNAGGAFWDFIRACKVHVLPNTAGCRTVKEAVTTAHLARELFTTSWVKLEVIGDDYTLQPDPFATVEAARILIEDGFEVFPYITDDLLVCDRLVQAGCRILMPWGSPIGSGKGIQNPQSFRLLRERFSGVTLIVDAGIGAPSHASLAMELGADGVLLNTAVAKACDSPKMAKAFRCAIEAGREGYLAGLMEQKHFASASTPLIGLPFQAEGVSH